MCCDCDLELVSAFLDGELDYVVLGTVTSHLLECENCCQTMGWFVQVRDCVSDGFVFHDSEEMTQSVMMALKNEKVSQDPSRLSRRLCCLEATTDE